jgi:hypothetical protein
VPRDLATLVPIEVANAARWQVNRAISIQREELTRATAAIFGFTSLGKKIRAAMDEGIVLLVAAGEAAETEGSIHLED